MLSSFMGPGFSIVQTGILSLAQNHLKTKAHMLDALHGTAVTVIEELHAMQRPACALHVLKWFWARDKIVLFWTIKNLNQ